MVSRLRCLFGSAGFSSSGDLLGFLRLQMIDTLTNPSWEGPGERAGEGEGEVEGEHVADRRLPFTEQIPFNDITGLSLHATFLPLSALVDHILPTLTSHDTEQGELASAYLRHVVDQLNARKEKGEMTARQQHRAHQWTQISNYTFVQYVTAIPHVIPISRSWFVKRVRTDSSDSTSSSLAVPVRVSSFATVCCLVLFMMRRFSEACLAYRNGFFTMQSVKLRLQQKQYASERPHIVDHRHHPHVLELTEDMMVFASVHVQWAFQCEACGEGDEGQRYSCWRCNYHLHIRCISREGVEVLSAVESRKRKRRLAMEERSRDQSRGPFFVFSVSGDRSEVYHSVSTYANGDELRAACREELQQIREKTSEKQQEEPEEEEEEEEEEAKKKGKKEGQEEAEDDEDEPSKQLSLDELVLLVINQSREADRLGTTRSSWREVVEGGRVMRSK